MSTPVFTSGSVTMHGLVGSPVWATTPKPRKNIVGELVDEGYWVKATGSRVTKDGWGPGSDWDYVVYDPEDKLLNKLNIDVNWSSGTSGSGERGVDFNSLRQGETNLILVREEQTWKNYIIATNLIRVMNCETKKKRIAVFDSVFGRDVNSKAVEF